MFQPVIVLGFDIGDGGYDEALVIMKLVLPVPMSTVADPPTRNGVVEDGEAGKKI